MNRIEWFMIILFITAVVILVIYSQSHALYKVNPYTGKMDYYERTSTTTFNVNEINVSTITFSDGTQLYTGTGLFQMNSNGDVESREVNVLDVFFEVDSNGDITTKQ